MTLPFAPVPLRINYSDACKDRWLTDTVFQFREDSPVLERAYRDRNGKQQFERITDHSGKLLARFRSRFAGVTARA